MTATRHNRPSANIGIGAPCQGSRRPQYFAWKLAIARRDRNSLTRRDGPSSVHACIVRPEGRADSTGEPIQADVRQKGVLRERRIQITAAIRPRVKFLDDPRRQTRGRISQRECESLGARALDPLIATFLLQPCGELV